MMHRWFRAKEYFKYLSSAWGIHSIHSPFIYDFFKEVLLDRRRFYCYDEIEDLRKQLLHSDSTTTVKDLGAGSEVFTSENRKVKSIARHSATSAEYAQLLFRTGNHFSSKKVLELGTSLGLTTLYFSSISNDAKVITLEGDPNLAKMSSENFLRLKKNNIMLLNGPFNEKLPVALSLLKSVDLVYMDGDHGKEPTRLYFNILHPYIHENTILVIGDIHWSPGMKAIWKEIAAHAQVTASIDLFYLGIIFFRKELSRETFILRF
ncbi:MAG: class I SAM-dependent methyltransferase [Chitinophagales bacterium]